MANVRISQLPAAPDPIDGSELVPIVQNGQTVQTTVNDLISSPSLTQTFLTKVQEPSLPNSRYLGVGTGLSISDAGAQNLLQISPSGALASLVNSGTGIQVKTDATTLTNRSIATSGNGLSISNGSGVSGNPTLALSGLPATLANTVGTGLLALNGSTTLTPVTIIGTTNQITTANGNGASGNPTIGLADNPIIPGTGSVQIPSGTTAQRSSGINGQMRYNTDTGRFEIYDNGWANIGLGDGNISSVAGTANQIVVVNGSTAPVISIDPDPTIPGTAGMVVPVGTTAERSAGPNGTFRYNTDTATFEGYANGVWGAITTGSGVTSIATGTGLTGGPITSTGTISIANTAVTAGSYGSSSEVGTFTVNAQGQLTAAASVAITPSAIGAITAVNGTSNEITTSQAGTVTTVSLPNALTFTGKTVTGGAFNMTSATVGSDTVTTNTATQTLSGKTISGASNTLTNIGNSSLTNSSVTLGTTNVALGGTALTLGGITTITVTQDPVSNFQLATKQYVDTIATAGIDYHQPVFVESPDTAGNLNATYNQPGGAGIGVGATLTNAGTQVALTIDGVLMTVGKRVLIYNQTNQFENGVYTVTVVGDGSTNWVLTRATDADSYGINDSQALDQGSTFFVTNGLTGAGETYTCTTTGVITFGVTAITFAQISASQVYSAGTGLNLTGTTFSIANTAVTAGSYGTDARSMTLAVNAQGQITSLIDQPISIAASQINTTIPNSGLTNSSITINGSTVSLGGSVSVGTVTSITSSTLTVGGTSAVPTIDLTSGIVTPGTTGSSTQVPVVTVDTYGRVTGITTAAIGGGTVTSVSGTGTVSGITLSGTVTTSGSLTLGGSLDLSSPPAIGGTTPAAITGTTITASNYVGVSGGTF